MARHEIITDDFDGSQPATSVLFAFEGSAYSIDLSPAHRDEMRGLLAPYLAAAHRLGETLAETVAESVADPEESSTTPEVTPFRRRPREERIDWRRNEPRNKAELHRAARSFGVRAGLLDYNRRGPIPDFVLREFYAAHPGAWREPVPVAEPTVVTSLPLNIERSVTASEEVLAWARLYGHPVRGVRVPVSTMHAYEDYLQRHSTPEDDPGTGIAEVVENTTGDSVGDEVLPAQQSLDETAGDRRIDESAPTAEEVLAEFGVGSDQDRLDGLDDIEVAQPSDAAPGWDGEYSSLQAVTGKTGDLIENVVEDLADVAFDQPPVQSARPQRNHDRIYPRGIREWARAQGYRVGRARIKPEIVEAFLQEHPHERPEYLP